MKKTNEILEQLQHRFVLSVKTSRFWSKLAIQEEELNHHKKAQQYDAIASSYGERRDECAHMYAFIKEIPWTDAYHELYALLEETK